MDGRLSADQEQLPSTALKGYQPSLAFHLEMRVWPQLAPVLTEAMLLQSLHLHRKQLRSPVVGKVHKMSPYPSPVGSVGSQPDSTPLCRRPLCGGRPILCPCAGGNQVGGQGGAQSRTDQGEQRVSTPKSFLTPQHSSSCSWGRGSSQSPKNSRLVAMVTPS